MNNDLAALQRPTLIHASLININPKHATFDNEAKLQCFVLPKAAFKKRSDYCNPLFLLQNQ